MRIHKTKKEDRKVYKYKTARGIIVIKPGENDVTEIDIKLLHSQDDSEVYNNLKNLRPGRTKEEKAANKEWQKSFIENFKREHGYEPNKDIVNDAVEEEFPRNYNLSLDFDNNGMIDPDKRLIETLACKESTDSFEWSERMETVLELLTEKQRLVIELKYMEGYKQSEIAKIMGVSSAAVKKHFDKAKAIIREHY